MKEAEDLAGRRDFIESPKSKDRNFLKKPRLFCRKKNFLRFYLFIYERHRERGRDIGRGRSRLHAGSPMRDSIPGPRDTP